MGAAYGFLAICGVIVTTFVVSVVLKEDAFPAAFSELLSRRSLR